MTGAVADRARRLEAIRHAVDNPCVGNFQKGTVRFLLGLIDAAPDGGGWRLDRPGAYWVKFRETGPWQICHWITPREGEEPYWYWTSRLIPVEIGPYIPRPAETMVTPRDGSDPL